MVSTLLLNLGCLPPQLADLSPLLVPSLLSIVWAGDDTGPRVGRAGPVGGWPGQRTGIKRGKPRVVAAEAAPDRPDHAPGAREDNEQTEEEEKEEGGGSGQVASPEEAAADGWGAPWHG